MYYAYVATVALQSGLSMASASDSKLSGVEVAAAIGGGLVCVGGWVWLAVAAFRRIALPALTTTEA